MKSKVRQIIEELDEIEDLDRIIKVRQMLLDSSSLEEFEQKVADGKAMYYLKEFARAHEDEYGD